MTREQYDAMTEREFRGRRARVVKTIATGVFTILPGADVTIVRKFAGFDVETTRCGTCGVSFFARRVSWESLELVPEFETIGDRERARVK